MDAGTGSTQGAITITANQGIFPSSSSTVISAPSPKASKPRDCPQGVSGRESERGIREKDQSGTFRLYRTRFMGRACLCESTLRCVRVPTCVCTKCRGFEDTKKRSKFSLFSAGNRPLKPTLSKEHTEFLGLFHLSP